MAEELKRVGLKFDAEGTVDFQKSLKGVTQATRENYAELKLAQSQYDKNTSITDKLRDRQTYLTKQTEVYSDKSKILNQQIEEMSQDENADQEAIEKKKTELTRTQTKLNEYSNSLKEVNEQLKTGSAQMKEWSEKVKSVGDKVTEVGEGMTKAVTVPVAGIATASVAAWKEVDEAMDTVTTKTGASGAALQDMQQRAKDIATTIPVSFQDAADAVGEVNTRFGLTGDDLQSLSEQFVKFASLNNTDVSTSIDNVQKAMAATGTDVSDAADVLDIFNAVGQQTGISMDELSNLITNNASSFKSLGLGINQSAALVGIFEKSGVDASAALGSLAKAQKNAASDGKTLNDALSEFSGVMNSNASRTEKLQAAYDLFGKSGDKIFEAIESGSVSIDDLGKSVGGWGDSVSNTFDETLDPLDQAKLVLNNLKETGAEIIDSAGPMIIEVMKNLASAAKALNDHWNSLSDGQKEMVLKIAMVAAAAGPLIAVIGNIITGVGTMMSLMSGISLATAGPVILAIAAVAAIAVGLYEAFKHWDDIKAFVGGVRDAVVGKFQEMGDAIKNSTIVQSAKAVWENVKTNTQQKLNEIKSAYISHGGGVKGIFAGLFAGLKATWTTGYNNLNQITGGKLGEVVNTVRSKFNGLQSAASSLWSGIKSAFKKGISNIENAFKKMVLKFPKIKLPHFSISGAFSLDHPKVPSLSVDWYAKAVNQPYLFTSPTIMPAGAIGAGEASREIMYGKDSLMNDIRSAMADSGMMERVINLLEQLVEKDTNAYIDGKKVTAVVTNYISQKYRG